MAAFVYVAGDSDSSRPSDAAPPLLLESDGVYWFLYRYFEAANLDRANELIDLYGGSEIDGYQLHRLRQELEQALQDVQQKTASWRVLVGWKGNKKSIDTEDWRMVLKEDVLSVIGSLLALVRCAETSNLKLFSSGD
jgi:hypothetical protein